MKIENVLPATRCQVSAATACATRSAAPTAARALPTEPTATSACVRWASGELCARRVSGFCLLQPLLTEHLIPAMRISIFFCVCQLH